jgi:tetratricopeptide (TPR) repeat protein
MSRRTSASAPASRAGRPIRPSERELLAQLGLPESAGPSAIDAAHADVVAFLEAAPTDLRAWAQAQITAADAAYALLSDPDALQRTETSAVAQPVEPTPVKATDNAPPRRSIGRLGRLAIGAAVLAGTLAAGYLVYASDVPTVPGLTGTPAPEASQPSLDSARVAQVMQTIQSDPNNVSALQELADLYFEAGDYTTAAEWEVKLLEVDPDNVVAHLALGAALYNDGNSPEAETHWRRVLELDSLNVEAHYDLGFMYFSQTPPDLDQTIAEWRQVIDIAPDSDIARTVAAHLDTIEQWQASSSPSTSPAAGRTTAPAPSTSPSAAPADGAE